VGSYFFNEKKILTFAILFQKRMFIVQNECTYLLQHLQATATVLNETMIMSKPYKTLTNQCEQSNGRKDIQGQVSPPIYYMLCTTNKPIFVATSLFSLKSIEILFDFLSEATSAHTSN
jgi:hypothetical protein